MILYEKVLKLLKLMRVNGTRKRQHQGNHGEQFVQRSWNDDEGSVAASNDNVMVLREIYQRTFTRESNKKRHKCIAERLKPVYQQKGAVYCSICNAWFYSITGFSEHNYRPET